MSYDARHPESPVHAYDPAHVNPYLAAARLHPDLLHKVGEVFSVALSRQLARLSAGTNGQVAPDELQRVQAELAHLERFGVQLQEIARVLAREGGWVNERVNVGAAIRQTLALWAERAALAGATLSGPDDDPDHIVNPAVLEQLLELGVEYALHLGDRISLRCVSEGEPPGPVLVFDIQPGDASRPGTREMVSDDLAWQLFHTLARAIGWQPRRQSVGRGLRLSVMLATPGDTEVRSAALLPRTPVAAGRRVLLVDPQDLSREEAMRLMREVGMQVDVASSVEQALAQMHDTRHVHTPELLLTGVPADAPDCAAFIDRLRAEQPQLRVVEIVDDDSAFTFSAPGPDNPARVGRHTLGRTLVAAVSQELDAL